MYYRIVPKSEELYHYGVMGMHWGVRRYQNYDGSRIGAGSGPVYKGGSRRLSSAQRRYAKSVAGGQGGSATGTARLAANANSNKKSIVEVLTGPEVKKGKGKENSSHLKEITKDVSDAAESAGRVAEDLKKRDKRVQAETEQRQLNQRQKAQQMSDKELRDSINRIKMEREYVSLTTKEVETGYDKFRDVMHDVRDVAATAAAIAGVVLTIIKIKQSLGHSGMISTDEFNELYSLVDSGDYDEDFISHAMNLDLDYIMTRFDLSEDGIQQMIEASDEELYHHGIKGMHWGVRRYQNYDGTRIGGGGGIKAASPSRKMQASNESSKRLAKKFRSSVAGGQGGSAKGTSRLAATPIARKRYHDRPLTNKDLEIARLSSDEKSDALAYQGYKGEKEAAEKTDSTHKESGIKSNNLDLLEREIDSYPGLRDSISRGKKVYESLSSDEVDTLELNSLVYQMTGSYDVDSRNADLIFRSDGSTESRPRKRR